MKSWAISRMPICNTRYFYNPHHDKAGRFAKANGHNAEVGDTVLSKTLAGKVVTHYQVTDANAHGLELTDKNSPANVAKLTHSDIVQMTKSGYLEIQKQSSSSTGPTVTTAPTPSVSTSTPTSTGPSSRGVTFDINKAKEGNLVVTPSGVVGKITAMSKQSDDPSYKGLWVKADIPGKKKWFKPDQLEHVAGPPTPKVPVQRQVPFNVNKAQIGHSVHTPLGSATITGLAKQSDDPSYKGLWVKTDVPGKKKWFKPDQLQHTSGGVPSGPSTPAATSSTKPATSGGTSWTAGTKVKSSQTGKDHYTVVTDHGDGTVTIKGYGKPFLASKSTLSTVVSGGSSASPTTPSYSTSQTTHLDYPDVSGAHSAPPTHGPVAGKPHGKPNDRLPVHDKFDLPGSEGMFASNTGQSQSMVHKETGYRIQAPAESGFKARWKDWLTSLSKGEENALSSYTGSGYKSINHDAKNGHVSEKIKNIDSALQKGSLEHDTLLFRGVPRVPPPHFKVGTEFADNGYQSTSVWHQFAKNWSQQGLSGGTVLVIKAKAGTKGAFVSHGASSVGNNESEFLLPRGVKYRITKTSKDGKTHYLHVEMI